MIVSQLYTTSYTQYVGITLNQFTEEFTSNINDLTQPISQESYWLGYISIDNLPIIMQNNTHEVLNDKIIIRNNTDKANFPCGYVQTTAIASSCHYKYMIDGNAYINPNNSQIYRFINELHPEYSSATCCPIYNTNGLDPAIGLFYYEKSNGDIIPRAAYSSINTTTIYFHPTVNDGMQGLYDFIQGNKTITATIGSYTYDLQLVDEFADDGVVEVSSNEDSTRSAVFIIADFILPGVRYTNANYNASLTTQFCAKVTHSDGEYNFAIGRGMRNFTKGFLGYSRRNNNFFVNSAATYNTGCEGEFDLNEVVDLDTTTGYLVNNNIFVWSEYASGASDKFSYFCQILNASELVKMFSLIYRVAFDSLDNPTVSYVNGVTYATDVTENNEFLAKLKTGNIADDSFKNSLRPWQYSNIQTEDFTEDDVPPYVPPSPDTDDNTESGDKVPNQFGRSVGVTSNFVTNYLMTEGQISKLGEVLWTSWADDAVTMDMVNNFYGKFHDATGSWNVSDALQFIVSCRLFPCSLATLVNTTQVSSIPIGTGAFALQCGTQAEPNFFIANEATAVLNCGDVYIPREFNDYRDFENTKVTAYLPFCGSVELNPQDVVNKWVGCTYVVDLFDGSCKAFLYTLSGNDVGYEGAYYNVAIKQGQCGFLIPLSASQAGQVASRQKVDGYTDGALLYQAATGLMESAMALGGYSDSNPVAGFNRMVTAGTASTALTAQRLGRAGISAPSTSGGSGFTDFHQPAAPYIQVRRSRYQEPLQYEHATAYPTNAQRYDNLSQFTGFVICHNVDLSGFTCHEDERSEIKALLESGVYL